MERNLDEPRDFSSSITGEITCLPSLSLILSKSRFLPAHPTGSIPISLAPPLNDLSHNYLPSPFRGPQEPIYWMDLDEERESRKRQLTQEGEETPQMSRKDVAPKKRKVGLEAPGIPKTPMAVGTTEGKKEQIVPPPFSPPEDLGSTSKSLLPPQRISAPNSPVTSKSPALTLTLLHQTRDQTIKKVPISHIFFFRLTIIETGVLRILQKKGKTTLHMTTESLEDLSSEESGVTELDNEFDPVDVSKEETTPTLPARSLSLLPSNLRTEGALSTPKTRRSRPSMVS